MNDALVYQVLVAAGVLVAVVGAVAGIAVWLEWRAEARREP